MSDYYSEAEDGKLLRMYCADDPPRTIREIADELERSKSSVDRRITALGLRGYKGDRAYYEKATGVALDPVISPVRVNLPSPPTAKPLGTSYSTLVWGDVHYPFQDERALDVLRQIARDLQPDVLVCIGDVFDFFELSEFRPPEDIEPDIQETLNAGVQHLADMVSIASPKRAYFLGGNHEDRWDRMLLQARRDPRFRQLLKLPKIRRSLDFPEVLGFEDLGYDYRSYTSGGPVIENNKLLYTHGDRTGNWVGKAMLDKYGKNVMFGHMHRIQNYTKRDLKGQEAGWCIGCLCTLEPHYDIFANWQHGFAIVNWKQIAGEWFFSVEQIRIHDGVAIWRDKVYTAQEVE